MDSQLANRNKSWKRGNYLDWPTYFMATAMLAGQRSKDPCTQVGACIVNENNIIVGIGYNGMPKGCSDDKFPWIKKKLNKEENKSLYVCHAELNAILNKNSLSVKDCILYVALFPCNECAKAIIQSGIKEVIYISDKHSHKRTTVAAKRMFDAVGISYKQFTPSQNKITIDFSEIDWDNMNQLPSTSINDDVVPEEGEL